MSIEPESLKEQDFVVFGMKACDVKGLEVLDNVFLSDPIDTFYAARRDHGTIVALACHEPEETCFCKVFGVDAANPASDVAAWAVGEDLYWKPLTEKGEALTEAVKELLTEDGAGEAAVEAQKEEIALSVLGVLARKEGCTFLVFSDNRTFLGDWEDYGYREYGRTHGFVIYVDEDYEEGQDTRKWID